MWDKRYAQDGFLFGTEPAAALRKHAPSFPEGGSCLCVADGEGRNSVWLAKQGHQVTAWDVSSVAVQKAKGLSNAIGVTVDFCVDDAVDYDWHAAQYDIVAAIFIQFAGPELRDAMFAGMKQATRPGGLVFLHGYTPDQIAFGTGGPGCAEHLYTEEMLQESFGDFEILQLEHYVADIDEGTGHCGTSALIDLVARKPD